MPGFIIGGKPTDDERAPANTVETLRQHRWRILTLGPLEIRGELPVFLAESLQLPNVDIEVHEIKGSFLTYKFAKGVRWDDVTVTFYDTAKLYLRLVEEWRDRVFTNERGIGGETDQGHAGNSGYKQDTCFQLLDGKGEPDLEVTLKGSWPRRIAHGPLSYGASEIKLVTVTLSYDHAIFKKGEKKEADKSNELGQEPMMQTSKQSKESAAERTAFENLQAAEDIEEARFVSEGPPEGRRRSRF